MKGKFSYTLIHVLGTLLFLVLPVVDAPTPQPSSLLMLYNPYFEVDFFAHLFVVIFFYINFFIFIPKFYFTRRYVTFISLLVVSFLLIQFIPQPLSQNADIPILPYEYEERNMRYELHEIMLIRHSLFLYLIALFLAMFVKINERYTVSERQKHAAELSYLRAQINPHFLFNTLNSIYSLAIAKSDLTSMAIVKLSGMMRYIIQDADKDFVLLSREVSYISDYIELQKLRLGYTTNISYNILGEIKDEKITPLVLISFIENVFKHAVNPEFTSFINIVIELRKNSKLDMRIVNNKMEGHDTSTVSMGIGIKNSRKRLELLYPSKHELVINDSKDHYSVSLILDLK